MFKFPPLLVRTHETFFLMIHQFALFYHLNYLFEAKVLRSLHSAFAALLYVIFILLTVDQ